MKKENKDGATVYTPESYSDCAKLISSDYERYLGKSVKGWAKLWLWHFRDTGMGFLFYYRLAQHKGLLEAYFRLRMEKYVRKYHLMIPRGVAFGCGIYLGHGVDIVINGTAVIGSNVNLSQFSTIGSMKGHAATICDGAYLGPSVCTVENVRIGANAMIGAGAVVKSDVPDGAIAAGVPAKVIRQGEYTPHWPANIE